MWKFLRDLKANVWPGRRAVLLCNGYGEVSACRKSGLGSSSWEVVVVQERKQG
jgi:hypothetical protein